MQTTDTTRPTESPDANPLTRLTRVLLQEGFTTANEEGDLDAFGEMTYRREEKVLFAQGETIFVFIKHENVTEKSLIQAVDAMKHLYGARGRAQKALAVLQSTTVYVCIIAANESPHYASMSKYISSAGGAVFIPIVIVPAINQVVYPALEEGIGPTRARLQYLQYLLGERREPVRVHKQTIQTFYISLAFVGVLLLIVLISLIT